MENEDSQELLSLISGVNRNGGTNWTAKLARVKFVKQKKFDQSTQSACIFLHSCLTATRKQNSKLSPKSSAALLMLLRFFCVHLLKFLFL